jgi:hypothetical protein
MKAGQCLSRVLRGEYGDLLSEWCRAAVGAGVRAPDELLPGLLDRITSSRKNLDPAMREVLGQRGRWLAAHKPGWHELGHSQHEDAQAIWETGTRQQRKELLRALRASEPAAARTLLERTWAEEDHENRAAFAQIMRDGLSLDDEPFLETLLGDSRKPIRSTAADLLASLPGSALGERMKARVVPLLRCQPSTKGLIKLRRAAIEVVLPEKCDKALMRDGVDARGRPKMGPKAYWLCQMLGSTPLETWTTTWHTAPAAILDAASRSDFQDALVQGWALAAMRQRSPQWAEALLDGKYMFQADEKQFVVGRAELLQGLMRTLDTATRERILTRMLTGRASSLHKSPVLTLLRASQNAWSEALSHRVLDAFRAHFARYSDGYDYELRHILAKEFAILLAPGLADDAAQRWPTKAANWNQGNDDMVSQLVATLQFRRAYLEDLKS